MKQLKAALFIMSALVAVALAGGCNLAPAYHPPTVQTPPAFKETNGWKMAQPSDAVIKGRWWEVFNDTNLNALEEQVAISNQNIAAAVQNFFAARALVKEARAAYYPTASVDPSVTKTHTSARSSPTAAGHGTTSTLYSLPADASWQLDLWDSVRNTVRADTFAAQSSAALIENMKLSAQAELAQDYYGLRGQDELIELFRETVKAYRDSLDLTTTLFETGIDSALDEAEADALLQTTIAQSEALAIQRAQYEHAIALLIGQPASSFSIKPGRLVSVPPVVPLGLPLDLLERRPDVASAERNAAEANAQIGVVRAAWLPTVTLTGAAGYESTSLANLISPPSFMWSLGAGASEVVFDAGKRKAADEQAWANYRSMVATYRQTVLTAFQQVEDYLASLRVLWSEIQQQGTAVKASQKSLDLSMERYRTGVASYLNVITAQETLLGNQQTDVTLRTSQMTSTVQLILALGGGWTNSDLPAPGKLALKDPSVSASK